MMMAKHLHCHLNKSVVLSVIVVCLSTLEFAHRTAAFKPFIKQTLPMDPGDAGSAVSDSEHAFPVPDLSEYGNLFLSHANLQMLLTSHRLPEIFVPHTIKRSISFNKLNIRWNSTDFESNYMSDRLFNIYNPYFNRIRSYSCCETRMFFDELETVQSDFDGRIVDVVQHPEAAQIVHKGECARPNTPCEGSGKCQVEYRLHWVQVQDGERTRPVPTAIPNHCKCQHRSWW